MMLNRKIFTALAAFATCMTLGSSAFADNDHGRDRDRHDNGNHYGQYKKYHNDNYRYDRWDNYGRDYRFNGNNRVVYRQPPVVVIHSNDRVVIRDYYRAQPVIYRPANHRNWNVGYALPHYVQYERIPPRLLHRLQPVPVGYEYVRVNGDVLLIQDATRLVIDAITLL